MTIQEVKDRWSPGMKDPQAAIDWWNSKAGAFASRDIPTAQSSLAIRLITEKQMLERGQSSLDVGCGGGRFSFALEQLGACVTGIDFSPRMIEECEKSRIARASSACFCVQDWQNIDLQALGWKNKFDLVLANMTPAVVDVYKRQRLCVRPTSETLFCDFYKNDIHSYRDLPKVYNQWCSVVRWEKETRPFLRSREFLWQEGHTAHATMEEAEERTIQMLNLYADFCEQVLAMPVIRGRKTEKEKFAGAESTYTIEALMHDGKALQSGTSHNFGDGFAKAFGIQFTDKDNTLKYVYQTSWGMTTRLIGAIIMVHGDNSGLVLPPKVAPTQIVIIPIQQKKEGVLDTAYQLKDRLSNFRVKVDDSDKSPGWKFSEQEMRGIPIRVEIGPKDIEAGKCVLCRRDTREKIEVALEDLEAKAGELLEQIQTDMLERARAHRDSHTYVAENMEQLEETLNTKPGFVKAMWCGDQACEDMIKEKYAATSRCMPFEQEQLSDKCVCCGKPAKKMVYWGRAY